jgi:hypothetical protein
MGHLIFLLARFPISGCTYLSLQLEWRRWQKWHCLCQGNGYVCRCHSQRSKSICTRGANLACNHFEPHGGCCNSCCLSKSKTKNKSVKEILNENNSFFWTNCPCSTKRTGHCAWSCCSFSLSDGACNHPSCCRAWCSLSPCCHVKGNHGINCLDDDSRIGNCHGHISCFNGSHDIYDYNAVGSLIHSYM